MILIIKHAKIEEPGTLGEFFNESEWQIKTVELWNNVKLPPIDDCEAIISLGGPMNVYEIDKYSFLKTEEAFLKKALEKNIPILGICLGAQLLAKVAGAKVKKAKNKEIGWYSLKLTQEAKSESLFRGLNDTFEVFQWHQDTFEIPNKAVLLATSAACRNQAFRFGNCAWGLQFHPEMTAEMLESWLKDSDEEIDKDKLMLNYFRNRESYNKQASVMYLNFACAISKYSPVKI